MNSKVLPLPDKDGALTDVHSFKAIAEYLQNENETRVDLGKLREVEGIHRKQEFLEFLLMRFPYGGKDDLEEKSNRYFVPSSGLCMFMVN